MSKVLITGGFGFLGGRLTRRLSEEHEVWVTSRNPVSEEIIQLHGNVRRIDHARVLTPESFPSFIDTVIHLAALNEWDSIKYPSEAIRVNIDETRIILENCISGNTNQFIYFSTAHVYGAPLQGEITEQTLPVPVHPYAITHKAAEDYVVAATIQKKIRGTVVRLSNAFGAPVSPVVNRWTLLANDLCRQAVEKEKLVLRSNGCQVRDFICLSDVEEVVARMLINPNALKNIIYNLGSSISMRVIDMAELIVQSAVTVLKKNIMMELPVDATPTIEPDLVYSNNRLITEGFKIPNDVQMELEKLMQYCKENFSKTNSVKSERRTN